MHSLSELLISEARKKQTGLSLYAQKVVPILLFLRPISRANRGTVKTESKLGLGSSAKPTGTIGEHRSDRTNRYRSVTLHLMRF